MIRLSTLRKVRIVMCAIVCIALRSVDPCLAQRETEEPNVLPLSTDCVPVPGWNIGSKMFYTTVEWQGKEYGAHEGTLVLMEVIADTATDAGTRAQALERLSRLRRRDTTAPLLSLYEALGEREEKLGVMACLTWSEDPRGFPLFTRVLEHEKDDMVRLFAASALAHWNVRRGVDELVNLLDSKEILPQPAHRPYVRDNAFGMFRTENRRKGWGFPVERIQQEIGSRADLDDEQRRALYIGEIKKWFTANKGRFPDWKPGDPLPAAPKLPPIPPGPEDVLLLSSAFRTREMTRIVSEEKEEEVSWQGKRYPAAKAVDLLMKAALNPGSINDRILATHRLEHLGSQLRNTQRIPQLMKLYGRLTDRSERVALLFCLARSKDPRAIPLFGEVLDTRREAYLRLPAAYGLAMWNARCGVRELIELLSFKQVEDPIRYPGIIADEATGLLSRLNYWKSWWAPEAVLQAAVEARTEDHDELLGLCHTELKKWFTQNKHRFPEWKPGDPLPKVDQKEREPEADE